MANGVRHNLVAKFAAANAGGIIDQSDIEP